MQESLKNCYSFHNMRVWFRFWPQGGKWGLQIHGLAAALITKTACIKCSLQINILYSDNFL